MQPDKSSWLVTVQQGVFCMQQSDAFVWVRGHKQKQVGQRAAISTNLKKQNKQKKQTKKSIFLEDV